MSSSPKAIDFIDVPKLETLLKACINSIDAPTLMGSQALVQEAEHMWLCSTPHSSSFSLASMVAKEGRNDREQRWKAIPFEDETGDQ